MKKIFILLLSCTVIFLGIFFVSDLDAEDIEWFLGNEWAKRTDATNKELSVLPNGFFGQIYKRYEGSDAVNVWGPNDEFISFGYVVPEDFIQMKCGEIYQIGSLLVRCSNPQKKNDYYEYCVNEIMNGTGKATNIKTIIQEYALIRKEVEKLPSSFDDQYFTTNDQVCWATDRDIPAKPNDIESD